MDVNESGWEYAECIYVARGWEQVAGFFTHGYETTGSPKCSQFLD